MKTDNKTLLTLLADIEYLVRVGKRKLALERIAELRKEIEK